MILRRACEQDLPGLLKLLGQVAMVHHEGRPDLFKAGCRKYTPSQLVSILKDELRPIFVAVDDDALPGDVLGYAFCIHQQHVDDNVLTDVRTLYIDDLCVDEDVRGRHVGTRLYNHVLGYAREQGYYNVTLHTLAAE